MTEFDVVVRLKAKGHALPIGIERALGILPNSKSQLRKLNINFAGAGGPSIDPDITGNPYPGETLTSTVAGQWTVNGEAVSGETGTTFVVRLQDIGLDIRCGGSNALTCWHPNTIANVRGAFVNWAHILTSISPDTLAADTNSARRWVGIVNGYTADQETGIHQPIYRSDVPRLNFDGENDRMTLSDIQLRDFCRNVNYAAVYAATRSTELSGGATSHCVIGCTGMAGSTEVARFWLETKGVSGNFRLAGRRVNGDAFTSASSPSSLGWHVLGGEHNYAGGNMALRVNGTQTASASFSGSGTSENSQPNATRLGTDGKPAPDRFLTGDIGGVIITNGSTALTASDRNRIERYLGLLVGLDIPLI